MIIGLDAATPALVQRWVDEGQLPVLAGLMREGAWAPLRSVPNPISPAAWTTFMTGTNPGRHGIFGFRERVAGSYEYKPINGSRRDGVPFWRLLAAEGLRIGVMNVPMTYPAEDTNGFMLAGMDAPNASAPGFAYPPGLAPRLEAEVGKFRSPTEDIFFDLLRDRTDRALGNLLEGIEARTRQAEYLLRRYAPDVFIVVHSEIDTAQHFFWRYMDPRHPDYAAATGGGPSDCIRNVYAKADESVGRLIRAFGNDAIVMILSDHGAGILPVPPRLFFEPFLETLGLYVRAGSRAGVGRRAWQWLVRRSYGLVNPHLPGLRRLLVSKAPHVISGIKAQMGDLPVWSETKAYVSWFGEICLNVKGREPQGTVEPGAEYEEVRSHIIDGLHACVDPISGEPIVERAYRREEIFSGPYVDRAADIYVRLRDEYFQGFQIGTHRALFPSLRPADPVGILSGTHRVEGILMLKGDGIMPGAALHHPSLADIAPTVLHTLGAPVPNDLDGRVLLEAFEPDAVPRRVRLIDSAVDHHHTQGFSEAEEALIEERLRSLGYM